MFEGLTPKTHRPHNSRTQLNVCGGENLLWGDSSYNLGDRKPKFCPNKRTGNKTLLHSVLTANQYNI